MIIYLSLTHKKMKNFLFTFSIIILTSLCNAQSEEFVIFNDKGDIQITTTDDKGYVVSSIDGTAKELYDKSKLYVNELMVDPDLSIVADQTDKYLKWKTRVGFKGQKDYQMIYLTELSFKDGKIKIEYYIKNVYTRYGSRWEYTTYNKGYYSLYKDNGKPRIFEELVQLTENYLNLKSASIVVSLKGGVDDDW